MNLPVSKIARLSAFRVTAIALSLASILCTTHAQAQTTNASVDGSVNDPSGASVAGAQVTAKNSGTGLTETATTTDAGTYTLRTLPPGIYTITVAKQGFTTSVQNGLQLTVSQNATLKRCSQSGQPMKPSRSPRPEVSSIKVRRS